MKLKQKLSVMSTVLLILLQGFPTFALLADEPQQQMGTVTIQDSGTPSEPSSNQNNPPDALQEQSTTPSTPAEKSTLSSAADTDSLTTYLSADNLAAHCVHTLVVECMRQCR